MVNNIIQLPVRNYTPRRALMYVPGDDTKKINKAVGLDVDFIALDCEDGVAINRKADARKTIRQFLGGLNPKSIKGDLGVRVNSIDTGLCEDDLTSCLSAENIPNTVLLPKVESIQELNWFADKTDALLKSDKKINLIIYIETALAFINLTQICQHAVELSNTKKFVPAGLVFGSDDFCASIGATRTEDCSEVSYARQKLVLTAKAFNLQAIDMVYIKYKDLEGLRCQCEQGKKMGFTGKQVIHPSQVPVVQEAFLPSKEQMDWAEGLLTAFREHQKSGKGAFTYRGSMIDMPTMKQAQNVLELAKLAK
nr:unnamed protein product [Callosobruchus chinensis]